MMKRGYRGWIRRDRDGMYTGLCLELGLVVRARTIEECRQDLWYMVDGHLRDMARVRGVPVPVSWYRLLRLLFDLRLLPGVRTRIV